MPEHVRRNEALWDDRAGQYTASGERGWARDEPAWGIWHVPESQLGLLPANLADQDAFLHTLCMPAEDDVAATDRLLRPVFGMYRVEWPGDNGVEFHLSHGAWIRILRGSGFGIEDLIDVRPSLTSTTRSPFVTLQWARRWPCEAVWTTRRRTISSSSGIFPGEACSPKSERVSGDGSTVR